MTALTQNGFKIWSQCIVQVTCGAFLVFVKLKGIAMEGLITASLYHIRQHENICVDVSHFKENFLYQLLLCKRRYFLPSQDLQLWECNISKPLLVVAVCVNNAKTKMDE
jgi:hypothetical protein